METKYVTCMFSIFFLNVDSTHVDSTHTALLYCLASSSLGFPVAGAKLSMSVQASPWPRVWGTRWRSYGRNWAGCAATGAGQSLHRHTRTWTAQCKRVRIARGYAIWASWTSGRMILRGWKFLDFWHQETGGRKTGDRTGSVL